MSSNLTIWSDEQLDAVLRVSPDPILILKESAITDCNDAAVKWLGYGDKKQLLNQSPARFSPASQADLESSRELFSRYMKVANIEGEQRFEWIFKHADDTEMWANVVLKSVALWSGKAICCHIHDISDLKLTERNLIRTNDQLRMMFEMTPEPVWLIAGALFVDCNQASVKVLGYKDKAELLHRHPSDISPEVQPDGESSFTKANRMGKIAWQRGIHRFEWVHLRADGSEFYAAVTLTPIKLRAGAAVFCAWRDISEQKAHESKLKGDIASLKARLAQPDAATLANPTQP